MGALRVTEIARPHREDRDNTRLVQRIVLIDDSEEDRARIRAALMQGNPSRRYLFREAADGAEGLKLCQSSDDWPIDCVIIDVHMPRITGPEFLKMLREPHDFPILPVVVLTGSSLNTDAGMTLQLGAQDYVTKDSIYPSVLFRVVDNAIERHQLLRELHKSRVAAEAANRAKSAMVGNISHEIRTPMTAVMGLCDLLLESDLNESQMNLLRMVRENGEYLMEIVNDLLDISKLEAGGIEIAPVPFNLRGLLNRLVELMRVRSAENHSTLNLAIADDVPEAIESDPIRLRQIILNLVGNAIKFSPGGTVWIRVSVVHANSGDQLQIEVVDTGVGIPKDDFEKIFQPFVQSESKGRARSVGGTGLGLAICRRLVGMLGGELTVSSEIGVGSNFAFQFPLLRSDVSSVEPAIVRKNLTASVEELLDGCAVLVAEDTRATQVLITRILESVGGQVSMAMNGEELVRSYIEAPKRFKVIITDIQMPGTDGLEATRQLRKHGCQLPIIVLTADAISETRAAAELAGATDILTKPIDRTKLLETIARYCDEEPCNE